MGDTRHPEQWSFPVNINRPRSLLLPSRVGRIMSFLTSNVSTPQSYPVHNIPRNNFDSELWDDLANLIYANDPTSPGDPLTVIMPVAGRIQVWAMGTGTITITCDGVAFPMSASGFCIAVFDVQAGLHTITGTSGEFMMARRGRKPPK